MIKCPQCNYHNIDDHRFCQQCGTSLTQKHCASCGHLVDFDVTHCPQCGHPTGTIWWTLITPMSRIEQVQAVAEHSPTDTAPASGPYTPTVENILDDEEPSTEDLLDTIDRLVGDQSGKAIDSKGLNQSSAQTTAIQHLNGQDIPSITAVIQNYLDQNPRYQLLETMIPQEPQFVDSGCLGLNILDTQPLQVSPLAIMLNQLQSAPNLADMSKPGAIKSFLATQPLPFPVVLEPYLALRQQFPLLLPYVHDAWQSEHQSVILLENRTGLPALKEVIANGQISPTQILRWLEQTLNFASACSPWQCMPSVLHKNNLKVDQGQILCLQQLLFEPGQFCPIKTEQGSTSIQSPTWDDLRYVWLDLLQGLGASLSDQFQPLLTNLQTAENVIQEELQDYLNDLSQRLPSVSPSAAPIQLQQSSMAETDAAPTLILPNQLVHLAAAGQTDEGRDRHHNEDYFVIDQRLQQRFSPNQNQVSGQGLYILCDGMGGHAGGEIASSLAVETLTQYFQTHWQTEFPDTDMLKDAIYAANHALFQVNEEKAGSNRMGTTLVMALIQDTHIQVAHVGDSRLYRLTHQSGLEQITVDHEVGQREIQQGTDPAVAYARPDAYQLTQALGPRENEALDPDIQLLTATEDTLLLICSDGLTDNQLLEVHCDQYLLPMLNSQISLQKGVNELVLLANEHNGHDNITVIAILMRVQPQRASLIC